MTEMKAYDVIYKNDERVNENRFVYEKFSLAQSTFAHLISCDNYLKGDSVELREIEIAQPRPIEMNKIGIEVAEVLSFGVLQTHVFTEDAPMWARYNYKS